MNSIVRRRHKLRTPLNKNEQKAFFIWLNLLKQAREYFAMMPGFEETKTKHAWLNAKTFIDVLVDDFEYQLKQQSEDLPEIFWRHSELFDVLLRSIYDRCPDDSRIQDAIDAVNTVLSGESMIVSISEGEEIKNFYDLFVTATDNGKHQVLVNLRKNQK